MRQFKGKTALVTGASSGIGEQFARLLAEQGCHLVLVARREERLQALRQELAERHGVQVTVLPADLLQPRAAEALFQRTRELGLEVDVLINNAGFGKNGDFLDFPLETHTQIVQLNVTALTELTHLFASRMKQRGGGYILQVASVAGYLPTPSFTSYGGAKAYVLNFSQALARELKPHGIQVTVLAPGGTQTEFMDIAGNPVTGLRGKAMMSSREVALAGLKGLACGRVTVVPGWLYRFSVAGLRLIPRELQAVIAASALR